jgi:DNA-binding NarL/FixJ family response regulator
MSRHRRILIADDEELVRAGVATVLSRHRKYAICGLADDERRTAELAERTQPNLLLLPNFLLSQELLGNFAFQFP